MNRNFAIVLLNILVVIMVVHCANSVANKSNVAFVIDDTASMGSEIKQVKEKAASIFNAVHSSKSSKIGNFILVTFNDYEIYRKGKFINDMNRKPIKLLIVTSDAKEFLEKLNEIKVDGGGKCPEMCLEGIGRALQECNPYSFIYVFTDASAKDYKKSKEIEDLAQQKSIRITFLLTGVCNKKNHSTPDYTVYTTIARSTGGAVFHLKKNDINQIINYIKNEIQSPQTLIGSVPITPGITNVNVKTDTGMKNLSVAVNVGINSNVNLNILGPNGNTVPTTPLVNTPNTKVVTIPNPSGPYVATINSNGHGTATLQAATTIDFTHGFQILKPSSMGSTTTQPVPGEKSHLAIRLDVIGDKEVKLQNILILDMNDNEIQRFPAELVNEKDKLYVTAPFNPPNTSFKIAIIAVDKNTGDEYKRTGRTPIDPQSVGKATSKNPVVKIKNGPKINVKYGDSLALECMVTGYPKPTIVWEDKQSGKELSSSVYPIQIPYEYMSVLKLDNIDKIGSYKCKVTTNNIDYATDSVEVETFKPHFWNIIESPADTNIEYEKDAKVYCKVDAYPPARISWFRNGKELTNSVDFDIMDDKSTLLVKKMRPNLQGAYTCKAVNDDNSVSTLDFTLTLSGVEAPQIDKTKSSNTVTEGSKAIISCSTTKGSPVPSITWEFKRHDASGFASLSYTDEVIQIDLTQLDNAGVYKCHAKNIIGEDFHQIALTVQSVPQIDKSKPTYIAIQGSKVFISCKIMKGIPKPEINWEYKRKDTSNFVSIADTGEVIQIDSADLQNAGTYRCRAKNQVGEDSHNAELIVQYRPEIDKTKSTGTTIEGSQIDIPCRIIKGYPAPVITWAFKKKGSNNFISLSESGEKISITNAQLDDAGVYKCYAKNLVGDDFHEFEYNVNCAPEIDKSKPTTIAKRGDSAIIACRITKGIPDPAVSWEFKRYGDSVFVGLAGIGREVHISWADLAHAGVYRCKAKNAVAEDSFDSELIVQHPPVIDKIESSKTAVNGAKTVILCRILKGNPTPNIAWEFRRKSATAFIALPETGEQIEVDPVELDSAGAYRCTASNVFGQDVHETQLTVQNRPEIDKTKSTGTTIEGSHIDIPCRIIKGYPAPVITWVFKKKGSNNFISLSESGEKISITNAQLDDAGVYKCYAKNLVGDDFHEFEYNVNCAPEIDKSKPTIIAKRGDSAIISCRITKGIPDPAISWEFKRDGDSVFVGLAGIGREVHISWADLAHAGVYRCKAKNAVAEDSFDSELIVQHPPVIDKIESSKTAVNGAKTVILCRILKGNPTPHIAWEFRRKSATAFIALPETAEQIEVDPVDLDSAGVYRCTASNVIGQDVHETQLSVQNAPIVDVKQPKAMKIGETVTLSCDVTGEPTPVVMWMKDGVVITANQKYSIFQDHSLRFVAATVNDIGNYTCEAENLHGKSSKNATVEIYGPIKMVPPANTILNQNVGTDVELECQATGTPAPSITWQFFDVNGISKILSSKDPVLKINKIQAESAGYYICVAENGFDTGTIGFEILINFPVEIERPNQTEFNIIENDRVLRIPCKAKGFPEPLGTTWTMNSQPLVMGSFYETDSDGTLIIKNPDMSAAGKYMCIADNGIGRAYQPFTVNVSPYPVPSGPMETVLVEEKTSREIECKVPHTATDTIRWYTNGNQIPVTKLIIRNAKDSDSGVYSCHVSTLQGSQTAHMKVLVGSKPTFSYKRDNEIIIPYIHGRKSILDCYAKGNPPPTVTWWQGAKLGANAMTYGFLMDDSHLGRKTCEATNEFGTITRTYVIKIIGCSINYKEIGLNKYHPILVESRGKLAAYENQDGVMTIPESEPIDFVCPNGVRKGYCFNNEFIITDNTAASQHVQYSDLKCDAELQPTATTITLKNYPCSADKESRLYRVGYHTGSAFCAVYDVCLNPRTGKQIFIKHDVTRYASGVIIERKPFDKTLVPIDYDVMFECAKQSYIAGPGCCFEGRQLVSPLDVSPMVQKSTYFNLIVAPEWNFCSNYRNLDEIEKRIRDLAKASQYYDLEVFSGEFEDQNLYQLQDGYGNVKIAPKYLWKVVQIRQKSKGLAIVTINVPNLRDADVGKLVLCQDVCDVTDWMQGSQWRDVSAGYTFCCRPLEFVAAVNPFFRHLFQPNVLLKP